MAEQILTDFIRALRSADVRVSPGESIDAARAVKIMGYGNRARLVDTLRCVLAKTPAEKETHDRLFDLYFSRDALEPASDEDGAQSEPDGDAAANMDALDLIENADETQMAMAMEAAARQAGISDIRFSTQTSYFAQQMVDALDTDKLEREIKAAFGARTDEGTARAEALIEARKDLFIRARAYTKQAFETFGKGETEKFREDILTDKAISQLDHYDLARMKPLIAKMAKRLAVKHSRKRRKKNRGQLNVRKTMRANAGFDGVPFELSWKQTKRDRPKIVAICDVSGSVSKTVRFFLMLLYSLYEAVPDLSAYAFSGNLKDVGEILDADEFDPVMDKIIRRVGQSSTDYGQSLIDFQTDHWDQIDRRTTLIMLGDGRSNNADPRIDIFSAAAARAKRTIWLCPEPPSLWGTGDSEIPRYRPYCSSLKYVTTVKDLERVIDEVLASYN